MLLCEANQWPDDVVEYFGEDGDECQMAFHFPVMPRLFMAVRRESRYPISEIMAQTPAIPDNCQWGIFLRNHDELTLEMVTDEERDYMWAEYAKDPRMKANIGIRRRLAPLLDNDRNQLELFTALLLSLPGSPVLYYGDEIGMGDNIWLGDRDGVRTPMQWTPDRNAGFSTGDPRRLYLPVIMDPVYGYQVTNVEAQLRQLDVAAALDPPDDRGPQAEPRLRPRHLRGARRRATRRVLSFVREFGDDVVLCVNNLSRFPQPVELDLRRFEGYTPVELPGRVQFPPIGELPYLLTLPGHGFYWFELSKPAEPVADEHEDWEQATSSSVADSLLAAGVVSAAEETPATTHRATAPRGLAMKVLTDLFRNGCRTSAGSPARAARGPTSPRTASCSTSGDPVLSVHRVRVTYADGAPETYLLPLSWRDHPAETSSTLRRRRARRRRRELRLRRAARPGRHRAVAVHLVDATTVGAAALPPGPASPYIPEGLPGASCRGEQSNTSLGVRRRGDPQGLPPAAAGAQPRHRDPRRARPPQATRTSPRRSAASRSTTRDRRRADHGRRCCRRSCPTPATAGSWRWPACATCTPRPTCTPTRSAATSPARRAARRGHGRGARAHGRGAADRRRPARTGTPTVAEQMRERLDRGARGRPSCASTPTALRAAFDDVADAARAGAVQRVHGDFHLGQVLRTATAGWCSTSRASRPGRWPSAARSTPAARRRRHAALLRLRRPAPARRAARRRRSASTAPRSGQSATAAPSAPATPQASGLDPCGESPLLRAFETDKAVYECVYEARNRPPWLLIPLNSLARLTSRE